MLAPHRAYTHARRAEQAVVLCLQDTTALDFNGQAIAGLGPLSDEAQRGMYLHPTDAVSVQREPLGVLDAWMWARAADGTRPGVRESVRWSDGDARVAELAATVPATRLVYVADREADWQELMVRAHDLGTPADWLVRAKHNRALPNGQRLWAQVLASAPLGEIRFRLPGGRGRTARSVRQRIALPDGRGATFAVTCLIAREIGAPHGVKPIAWRLLTHRSAATLTAAVELIDWYRARWEIEWLFLVLKEGCRIEALPLGTRARIERAGSWWSPGASPAGCAWGARCPTPSVSESNGPMRTACCAGPPAS